MPAKLARTPFEIKKKKKKIIIINRLLLEHAYPRRPTGDLHFEKNNCTFANFTSVDEKEAAVISNDIKYIKMYNFFFSKCTFH